MWVRVGPGAGVDVGQPRAHPCCAPGRPRVPTQRHHPGPPLLLQAPPQRRETGPPHCPHSRLDMVVGNVSSRCHPCRAPACWSQPGGQHQPCSVETSQPWHRASSECVGSKHPPQPTSHPPRAACCHGAGHPNRPLGAPSLIRPSPGVCGCHPALHPPHHPPPAHKKPQEWGCLTGNGDPRTSTHQRRRGTV